MINISTSSGIKSRICLPKSRIGEASHFAALLEKVGAIFSTDGVMPKIHTLLERINSELSDTGSKIESQPADLEEGGIHRANESFERSRSSSGDYSNSPDSSQHSLFAPPVRRSSSGAETIIEHQADLTVWRSMDTVDESDKTTGFSTFSPTAIEKGRGTFIEYLQNMPDTHITSTKQLVAKSTIMGSPTRHETIIRADTVQTHQL